jgi:hypothetical protein
LSSVASDVPPIEWHPLAYKLRALEEDGVPADIRLLDTLYNGEQRARDGG